MSAKCHFLPCADAAPVHAYRPDLLNHFVGELLQQGSHF
jgi:hypothetical protein